MKLHEHLHTFTPDSGVVKNSNVNGSLSHLAKEIQDSIDAQKKCGGFVTASQLITQYENCPDNSVEKSSTEKSASKPKFKKFSLKKDPLHQTSVDSFFTKKREVQDTISSSESDEDDDKDLEIESDPSVMENSQCNIDENSESSIVDNNLISTDDSELNKQSSTNEINNFKHEFKENLVIDESVSHDTEDFLGSEFHNSNSNHSSAAASDSCKDPLAKKRVSHLNNGGTKNESPKVACTLIDLWKQQKPELSSDRKLSENSPSELYEEQSSIIQDKKRKLTVLFGDSDEEEETRESLKFKKQETIKNKDQKTKKPVAKGKKPSESDMELKCMAELVVRLLMPYYKKKKISSRDLFKALARALSQHASKLTKSSGKYLIS